MRGSLGSSKISRVGFKTIDISEGYASSAGAVPAAGAEPAGGAGPADGAEPAAGAESAAGAELAAGGTEPAAGAGSGEMVTYGVDNAGIRINKRPFEVSKDN